MCANDKNFLAIWLEKAKRLGPLYLAVSLVSPRSADPLLTSTDHRIVMLSHKDSREWIRAIECLLNFLAICDEGFAESGELKPLRVLVLRLYKDFQAGLDLALGGYYSSAIDTMRDVMEIEYLFIDFHFYPEHVNQWLRPANRKEKDKFSPINLRKRQVTSFGLESLDQLSSTEDYRNHSETLHVNPNPTGTFFKGAHQFDEVMSVFPIWELLLHGTGIVEILMTFASKFDEARKVRIEQLDLEGLLIAFENAQSKISAQKEALRTRAFDGLDGTHG